jgi:arsenate reductase (glutaredoxin)
LDGKLASSRRGRTSPRVAVAIPVRYRRPMPAVTVFHNPACSKCRRVLTILRERGFDVEVVEYLRIPPDRVTLERIVALRGIVPADLVRRDERFAELGLTDGDCGTARQVVDLLLAHPELMARPVVVYGERGLLARPPERVLELVG